MKKVQVRNLHPGMVTAEDVFAIDGRLIVPSGVVLTDNVILKLDSFDIFSIRIEDKEVEATSNVSIEQLSYKERVKQSPEFIAFKQDYDDNILHFQDSLNAIIDKNAEIDAEELINQTVSLVTSAGTSTSAMDMLMNLRDYDDSTFAHSINVAVICNIFAGWLRMSDEDRRLATACGLFHDVGKLRIPGEILQKTSALSQSEYEIIKIHTTEGYKILDKLGVDQVIKDAALQHHEKCDGSGYPYGFTSDKISKFAKLVTIVDIYDAMTSRRVHRDAMCPFTVITAFENEGLQKYDPHYILTFLENVVNSFVNQRVKLSNGMEGDIIYINPVHLGQPTVNCNGEFFDLSSRKDIQIEAIV